MSLFQTEPLNFCFGYPIDQVYKCFTCYNILSFLKKKGMLEGLDYKPENYEGFSDEEILLDRPGSYIIQKFPKGECRIAVQSVANTPSFKQFKFAFQTLNNKPLGYIFNFVFSFYHISENNSTFTSFYIECSKECADCAKYYGQMRTRSEQLSVCHDIEKYLAKWSKPELLMESTLINSSLKSVYKKIIDGSIFLQHPYFKNFNLVVERKPGLIGSTYLFMKKNIKIYYIIKGIEENSSYVKICLDKKTGNLGTDRELQFFITQLDDDKSILQYYSEMFCSVSGQHFNLFQRQHRKLLSGIKNILEKPTCSS